MRESRRRGGATTTSIRAVRRVPKPCGASCSVWSRTMADGAHERLRRWRLVLGGEGTADGTGWQLEGLDLQKDATLEALYCQGDGTQDAHTRSKDRRGGL